MSNEISVAFGSSENINFNYTHVDSSKACRVGESFAVTFYQLRYQYLADNLNTSSKITLQGLHPFSGIVLNRQAILQLQKEINTLVDNVNKEERA